MDAGLRTDLDRLATDKATAETVRRWLELPEELCQAIDRRMVVAIDEVQELELLARRGFEPFAPCGSATSVLAT